MGARCRQTPELKLIAEMADMFEVSIDALIGYEFRNNNREAVDCKTEAVCSRQG